MIDLHTLMISLLIVELLLALLMLLTAKVQRNYPGFNIWSISLIAIIISTVFLVSRGTIPDYISILPGNFFLLLSMLLMSESLHRFFTNTPLNRLYYVILVPVTILISYYTLVDDNISIRSLIISLASIFVIIITSRLIIRKSQKGNIPSLILVAILTILGVIMAVRGLEWIAHPEGRTFFEPTTMNIGLYAVAIIALLSITFMYLLLNFHRLAEELQESNNKTVRLLEDLDGRNRELENVSCRLQQLNAELDQKVQERTQRIENLLFQKDHFITQIAHDLRTPLTPLVAILPFLKREIRNNELQELIDILDQNVKYLHNMTEQIIKLAKINKQSSITDYHEKNLAELINEAIKMNYLPIKDKNLTVEVDIPDNLTVCVSKILGQTIFSNIINNAVKYNVKSGKVVITGNEDESFVSISVLDTGIGMESESIENIWEELYISDPSRSDPESKGLGLSMVRKIVALHGGEISASSQGTRKGSLFVIRLPRVIPKENIQAAMYP